MISCVDAGLLNLLETRREAGIPDAVPYQEAGAPPQSTEHPLQALRDKQHDDHQQIEAQNRSVSYHTDPYCNAMGLPPAFEIVFSVNAFTC